MQDETEAATPDDIGANNSKNCCSVINPEYIFPKLFYLCHFAGLGSFLPYLPLFYKQLGLPANRAGIISGIQPFVSFVFTPMWGALADKFKRGRLIFIMSFVALAGTGVAYLLTPMPPCNDDVRRESRSEIPTARITTGLADKFSLLMKTSQVLDRWTGTNFAAFQTVESEKHNHGGKFDPFVYLMLLSLFGTLFSCPGLALGDAAVVCLLRRNNDVHKYGKQKQWASIGWGLAAFTFGAIVSDRYMCPLVAGQKGGIDYSPCFYGSIVLKLLALFSGLRLDLNMNGKGDSTVENGTQKPGLKVLLKTVGRPRYLAFFITVLYSGMTFGMTMGFLFWHLEDCSAPQILYSIIPVVRCIADVIVYTISPYVISKIGAVNLIYLVLVGYVIRMACYASISSPWFFVPLEVLSGLTSAGGWAGFVTHIAYNSLEGAPATLQGEYTLTTLVFFPFCLSPPCVVHLLPGVAHLVSNSKSKS